MHSSSRKARRLGARLLVAFPIAVAALPAAPAHAGSVRLDTAGCGGEGHVSANEFTVPAGITKIKLTAHGEQGGGSTGGQGSWLTSDLDVAPGGVLYACVDIGGGKGGQSSTGPNGYDGGGYTSVSIWPDGSDPLMIAAGGGGAGAGIGINAGHGGAPGYDQNAANGGTVNNSGGGGGATGDGGGAAGPNFIDVYADATPGVIRKGGDGGAGVEDGVGGGGGGGGVWGGGAGSEWLVDGQGAGGGGGGGTSYCAIVGCQAAFAGGGAYVDITWVDPPAATTTTVAAGTNPTPREGPLSFEATVSPIPSGGTVAFEVDGQPVPPCTARPVDPATGKATCGYAAPATSGTHTVKASYSGVAAFTASADESDFTVTAPTATVTPRPADFGTVTLGASATRTVTVTNAGGHDLVVEPHGVSIGTLQALAVAPIAPNTTDFKVTADTCSGATVAAGATCAVTVTFKPSAAGKRTAQLTVDSDSETSVSPVALNGSGTLPAPPEPTPTPDPTPDPTPTPPAPPLEPAKPVEPTKPEPLKVAVSIPGVPKQSSKAKAALPVNPSKPLTVGCDTSAELDSCAVKLTVTVRRKPVVIGQATAKPGQQSVQIHLNATGRRLLAEAPAGLKVRVAVTGRSAEGVQTATAATRLVAKRTVTLLDGFDTNSAELTAEGRRFVDDLARELKGDAPKRIIVTGHTDSTGPASDAYRKALGLARAKAIVQRLRERGVESEFVAKSVADSDPAASEATAAGKAANRRVTLELQR